MIKNHVLAILLALPTQVLAAEAKNWPAPIKAIFLRAIFATRFFLTIHQSEITVPAQPERLDA